MRAVIFDLDDTLYPRVRFVRGGFAAVARHVERRYGVPSAQAQRTLAAAHAAEPGYELQRLAGVFGLGADHVPELLDVFRTHAPALWLYYDAEAALRQLRADDWRIGILTNGLPQVQRSKVEALGLAAFVDCVVFAHEHAPNGKPDALAFAEVLRRLDLPAHCCVMVGDDPECDIRGARDAGLRSIGIDRTHTSTWTCADVVLDTLVHLPASAGALVSQVSTRAA